MAQRRMLHEKIWASPKFQGLPFRTRLLFIGLITIADNMGRFRAELSLVKGKLFWNDPGVTIEIIGEDLDHLETEGFVMLWSHQGEQFGCLPTWFDHQTLRDLSSKLPKPPSDKVWKWQNLTGKKFSSRIKPMKSKTYRQAQRSQDLSKKKNSSISSRSSTKPKNSSNPHSGNSRNNKTYLGRKNIPPSSSSSSYTSRCSSARRLISALDSNIDSNESILENSVFRRTGSKESMSQKGNQDSPAEVLGDTFAWEELVHLPKNRFVERAEAICHALGDHTVTKGCFWRLIQKEDWPRKMIVDALMTCWGERQSSNLIGRIQNLLQRFIDFEKEENQADEFAETVKSWQGILPAISELVKKVSGQMRGIPQKEGDSRVKFWKDRAELLESMQRAGRKQLTWKEVQDLGLAPIARRR